jgi:Kef-type K+ transport system membrane component KefB
MDTLAFVGASIIAGFIGGKFSNKFRLPAVVGYLIAGLLLGPSFVNFLNSDLLERMGVFNDLALGLVAFIIGSEMHLNTLRKMGKGITTIIFSESFGAFLLWYLFIDSQGIFGTYLRRYGSCISAGRNCCSLARI